MPMTTPMVKHAIRRAIAAVVLLAYLPACTGWHRLPETQPAPLKESPQSLRITLKSGERIELRKARLSGDSLIGEIKPTPNESPVRFAVGLSSVQRIEDRKVNTARTVALVVGSIGVAALAGLLIVAAALDEYNFGYEIRRP